MSSIILTRNTEDVKTPLNAVRIVGANEYVSSNSNRVLSSDDIETSDINKSDKLVAGVKLIDSLSSYIDEHVFNNQTVSNSIQKQINDINSNIVSNKLSTSTNSKDITNINEYLDSLSSSISSINKTLNTIYPDKAVRFRGITESDPSTGIITLDGIKYPISSFTSENYGDIFYYRDVEVGEDGKCYGTIYAYIYGNGSIVEPVNDTDVEETGSPTLKKLGYGFYNNLSTLIVNSMVDDHADIEQSKISGLTSLTSDFDDRINELSSKQSSICTDLSIAINNISSQVKTDIDNISSAVDTSIDGISSYVDAQMDQYVKKSQIIQTYSSVNSSNLTATTKIPSMNVLTNSLKEFDNKYSKLGHKHTVSDITDLQSSVVLKTEIDPSGTSDSFLTSDSHVPSSKLLLEKINELKSLLTSDTSEVLTMDNVLSRAFPVGCIYCTLTLNGYPSIEGATWELTSAGKCLWGYDTSKTSIRVGSELTSALPKLNDINVTLDGLMTDYSGEHTHTYYRPGKWDFKGDSHSDTYQDYGKQLNLLDTSESGSHNHQINGDGTMTIDTDGQYFNSDHVQPPALVVYMYKRTK